METRAYPVLSKKEEDKRFKTYIIENIDTLVNDIVDLVLSSFDMSESVKDGVNDQYDTENEHFLDYDTVLEMFLDGETFNEMRHRVNDDIMLREDFNNYTDSLCKDGEISEWAYENWDNPF